MSLMMGCRCWRVDGALWMDICRREGASGREAGYFEFRAEKRDKLRLPRE